MMIEFEDHSEEEQQLLLRHLDRLKAKGGAGAPPTPPKPSLPSHK